MKIASAAMESMHPYTLNPLVTVHPVGLHSLLTSLIQMKYLKLLLVCVLCCLDDKYGVS